MFANSCLVFILLFWSLPGLSQVAKDSLLHLIRTLPEDTAKMDVYFQYGELMERDNLDSASFYYDKALRIAEQNNHVKGKIKYISYQSYVLSVRGELDDAYRWNREALQLARHHHLPLETAKALANLANTHNLRGELDTAVQYYMRAAELFDSLNNTRHLHILYINIGVAFSSLDQPELSLEYHRKSVRHSRLANDSATLVRGFINMGSSMNSLRMYDSAIYYLEPALAFSRRHQYLNEWYTALINLANSLSKKNRQTEAIETFEEALGLAKQIDYPGGIATAMNGLAMVLFELEQYQQADRYAVEAIRINEGEPGTYNDLRQQYKLLAGIKAKLGQTQAAYDYLEKYVALADSLTNDDVKRLTAELERKYRVAQKDKEIAQKELRIQQSEADVQKKNAQLMIIGGGLLSTLIILFLLYRFFRQRQRLQHEHVVSLQREQEVIRLRANLEGQQEERMRIAKEMHDDIGSGLTSLVFLSSSLPDSPAVAEKKEKIGGIARQLVNQMNEIVWSLNTGQDSLEDLIIYIRRSVSEMLETVSLEYEFRIPDNIPSIRITGPQRRHIYLVVKEAVHNAIKHASATKVTISMVFSEVLKIAIEDNGKGMSAHATTGNGLRNMQYRMEQAGGTWRLTSNAPVRIELTLPFAKAV